jgi:hypothetical protein
MFTKDYTLLVGLKYYIKLSTKLLSKEMLSTYIDLCGRGACWIPKLLGSRSLELGHSKSSSHVTYPKSLPRVLYTVRCLPSLRL